MMDKKLFRNVVLDNKVSTFLMEVYKTRNLHLSFYTRRSDTSFCYASRISRELEKDGLLISEKVRNTKVIRLTKKGLRIAKHLIKIQELYDKE